MIESKKLRLIAAVILTIDVFFVGVASPVDLFSQEPEIESISPEDRATIDDSVAMPGNWRLDYNVEGREGDRGKLTDNTDYGSETYWKNGGPAYINNQPGPPYYAFHQATHSDLSKDLYLLKTDDFQNWEIAENFGPMNLGPQGGIYYEGSYYMFVDERAPEWEEGYIKMENPIDKSTWSSHHLGFIPDGKGERHDNEPDAVIVNGKWIVQYQFTKNNSQYVSGIVTGPSLEELSHPGGGGTIVVPHGPPGRWDDRDTGDPDPLIIDGKRLIFHDGRGQGEDKDDYAVGMREGNSWLDNSEADDTPVMDPAGTPWAEAVGDADTFRHPEKDILLALAGTSDEEGKWQPEIAQWTAPLNWTTITVEVEDLDSTEITVQLRDPGTDRIIDQETGSPLTSFELQIYGLPEGAQQDYYVRVEDEYGNDAESEVRTLRNRKE